MTFPSSVRVIGYWIAAITHERYCEAYWEQVAISEAYINLISELINGRKQQRVRKKPGFYDASSC